MKICFLPIDNRPVCYSLAYDICSVDNDIELILPPIEMLGGLTKYADIEGLFNWLESVPDVDCMILSLDTLMYGGLIPSRRINDTFEQIKSRVNKLEKIIKGKKVLAFSSIMRISNNNYNEEEKEYWKDYGKKIFEYSYKLHKTSKPPLTDIPDEILKDYLQTRKRNFEINKLYLKMDFDTLVFSKDDCAEYGLNVQEAQDLEKLGGKTKTGADEIPLALLSRAIEKEIKVYPKFLEQEWKDKTSNYEDVSIEKSVLGQLELGGFRIAASEKDADIVLIVNNFVEKQGELVMGWDTKPFDKIFIPPQKPYAAADVRFANGADNAFVEQLLEKLDLNYFYGYAGWNTSANTLGSLLAAVKVKFRAGKYNDTAFKKLQSIRFLDDWAYQANVRGQIAFPTDITDMMKPYEKRVSDVLKTDLSFQYSYPWNRKFEIEIR